MFHSLRCANKLIEILCWKIKNSYKSICSKCYIHFSTNIKSEIYNCNLNKWPAWIIQMLQKSVRLCLYSNGQKVRYVKLVASSPETADGSDYFG